MMVKFLKTCRLVAGIVFVLLATSAVASQCQQELEAAVEAWLVLQRVQRTSGQSAESIRSYLDESARSSAARLLEAGPEELRAAIASAEQYPALAKRDIEYRRRNSSRESLALNEPMHVSAVTSNNHSLCVYKLAASQKNGSRPPREMTVSGKEDRSAANDSHANGPSAQGQDAVARAREAQGKNREFQNKADALAAERRKRVHNQTAEAHKCLTTISQINESYGGLGNLCPYRVDFVFCNLRPKPGSWAATVDCAKGSGGLGGSHVLANFQSVNHTKGAEATYWFACKYPGIPADVEYVEGVGLRGRCS